MLLIRPILIAFLGIMPAFASESLLTGLVTKVRDGDTIEVGNVPVRLNGISAPELSETLGEASRSFMVELVYGKRVRCELNGEKTYDRFVGICYLANRDIGAELIKAGLALDCPRFSAGRYSANESDQARSSIKLPRYCR